MTQITCDTDYLKSHKQGQQGNIPSDEKKKESVTEYFIFRGKEESLPFLEYRTMKLGKRRISHRTKRKEVKETFKYYSEFTPVIMNSLYKKNTVNYLPEDIRKQIKNKYGVSMSQNPTEEEMEKALDAWATEVNKKTQKIKATTNKILSKQDSALSKIEKTLKRIEELDKK